jgi:hypothetical protein
MLYAKKCGTSKNKNYPLITMAKQEVIDFYITGKYVGLLNKRGSF